MIGRVLLTKAEAAQALGVCERTLDNLRAAGELRARKIGKKVMFEPRELERFARRDHPTRGPSNGNSGAEQTTDSGGALE